MISNAGELTLVEYGSSEILGESLCNSNYNEFNLEITRNNFDATFFIFIDH